MLNEVSRAISASLDLNEIFEKTVHGLADAFGYQLVRIFLMQGNELSLQAQVGYTHPISVIHIDQGVIGRVARRFVTSELAPSETRAFGVSMSGAASAKSGEEGARLIVLVEGRLELEVSAGTVTLKSTLEPGDRYGETALLTDISAILVQINVDK